MDRFEKITAAYALFPFVFIFLIYVVSASAPGLIFGRNYPLVIPTPILLILTPIIVHFIYLKVFMNDVIRRDEARSWLFIVGVTGILGVMAYISHRRSE